ncbi:MAG: hypothetical protein AB9873_19775 [Syntrophobacteraceae bacterium]
MTVHDPSIVVCLLNDLLASARKMAGEPELPVEHVRRLVEECQAHLNKVKAIMESRQNENARDGARTREDWEDSESRKPIASLMHQVSECLQQCLQQLSARKKTIAEELEHLRRTQHATRAYYGLKPTSKHADHY